MFMPQRRLIPGLLLASLLLLEAVGLAIAEPVASYEFHHENVLGTSLDLHLTANGIEAARHAESQVLAEIDRFNGIFSTYKSDSEFSRWQQSAAVPARLSPELLQVLAASDQWRQRSGGAFNPAAESLSRLWRRAAERRQTPSPAELAAGVEQASLRHWRLEPPAGMATRLSTAPLNLNAIAKGYIIDRCCQAAQRCNGVRGVVVNIGGDLAARGTISQQVDIADPFHPAENAAPLSQLRLSNRALATSGNYHRGFVVAGRRHSHIVDPRSGQPADHVASASVLATSAMDADALATICCVLDPAESLRLVGELDGVDCLIVDRQGRRYQTAGWPQPLDAPALALAPARLPAAAGVSTKAQAAPSNFELSIELEINRPEAARYQRPYVAVWIEDARGFPVRTLALWIKTSGSGPTWIPDLKRWYRGDVKRLRGSDKSDLVVTRSSVTRPPGKHELVWDLTDNQKKLLPPGDYTVTIEAAREHGTYQIIRKQVTLGDAPFEVALDGNLEIKSARLEYRPAKHAP
jgi:thiamine biosynthesis lipoprotein ApbE